jgi:hypothetical protein
MTSLTPHRLQDLDDKIVVPILLVEGGKRIVYVSATTPDKRAVNINFEELAVLGEGSFGRVVKASLRGDETRKRITVAIKTVQQDRRFKACLCCHLCPSDACRTVSFSSCAHSTTRTLSS